MDKGEPPSTPRAKSLFRIGKNSRGNWVVQDQSGLCGGLFVDRAEAVKFAMLENGNRPQAVIMVPRSRARHAFADEKSLKQKREEDSIIRWIERLQ